MKRGVSERLQAAERRIRADLAGVDEERMALELFEKAGRVVQLSRVGLRGNTMRWMRFRMTREIVDGLLRAECGRNKIRVLDDGSITLYGMPVLVVERVGPEPWSLTLEIAA